MLQIALNIYLLLPSFFFSFILCYASDVLYFSQFSVYLSLALLLRIFRFVVSLFTFCYPFLYFMLHSNERDSKKEKERKRIFY